MSVTLNGDGVTTTYVPAAFPWSNATAPEGIPISVALSSGNNSLVVPSGTLAMLIEPPAASVVAKVLKGITGDTGFAISPNVPSFISLPASTTTVILNAASGETVNISWL